MQYYMHAVLCLDNVLHNFKYTFHFHSCQNENSQHLEIHINIFEETKLRKLTD